jgi:K+-transporting ATPase ATPase C chain
MFGELMPGLRMVLVMTVLTGLVYPALVTGIARVAFRDQADGSLVFANGRVIGSRLIGQSFTRPEYVHPRPSAAGSGYDATASGGTNLGPTSAKLLNGTTKLDDRKNEVVDFHGIKARIVHYCLDNGIPYDSSLPLDRFTDGQGNLDDVKLIKAFNDVRAPLVFTPRTPIPADAVTASASGLDPHISPANAQAQAARVAKARGVSVEQVLDVIARHSEGRTFGIFGEPRVNVLELNLDLDRRLPMKSLAPASRSPRTMPHDGQR